MNHYDVGRENEGEKVRKLDEMNERSTLQSPLFSTLKPIVQTGCKIAMKIAEKV